VGVKGEEQVLTRTLFLRVGRRSRGKFGEKLQELTWGGAPWAAYALDRRIFSFRGGMGEGKKKGREGGQITGEKKDCGSSERPREPGDH